MASRVPRPAPPALLLLSLLLLSPPAAAAGGAAAAARPPPARPPHPAQQPSVPPPPPPPRPAPSAAARSLSLAQPPAPAAPPPPPPPPPPAPPQPPQPQPPQPQQPWLPSPAAWWRFDGTLSDSVAGLAPSAQVTAQLAILFRAASADAGPFGACVAIDGSDRPLPYLAYDRLSLSAAAGWTMALWAAIQPAAVTQPTFTLSGAAPANATSSEAAAPPVDAGVYHWHLAAGSDCRLVTTHRRYKGGPQPCAAPGAWQHWALAMGTERGTQVTRVYLDGAYTGYEVLNVSYAPGAVWTTFGVTGVSPVAVSDLRFYAQQLTGPQVAAVHGLGLAAAARRAARQAAAQLLASQHPHQQPGWLAGFAAALQPAAA